MEQVIKTVNKQYIFFYKVMSIYFVIFSLSMDFKPTIAWIFFGVPYWIKIHTYDKDSLLLSHFNISL